MKQALFVTTAALFCGGAAIAEVQDYSVQDVRSLLKDWNLDSAFGGYFSRLQVDGDMLVHDLKQEHIDMASCPDATDAHLKKLFRKLKALGAAEAQVGNGNVIARRSLASSPSLSTGISIESDSAFISLGAEGDVVLQRAGNGALGVQQLTASDSIVVNDVNSILVGNTTDTVPYFSKITDWHTFVDDNPIQIQRGIPVTSSFTTGADYELYMEIMPTGTQPSWSNLIHVTATGDNCCNYGDRIPALWFYADTTRLHIRAGTNSSGNLGLDPGVELPLNAWTTVRIRCVHDTGEVWYNDTMHGSFQTDERLPHDNVYVYMADPWHLPAKAKLRNVMYRRIAYHHSAFYNDLSQKQSKEFNVPDRLSDVEAAVTDITDSLEGDYWDSIIDAVPDSEENWQYFITDPVDIRKNTPMSLNFDTGAEYEISLDIKPYGTVGSWSSILHITSNGENCCDYGERIPAMWFFANTARLHIVAGTNSSGNANFNPAEQLPMNTWSNVRLNVVHDGAEIYYNGTLKGTISTDMRMPHANAQVWMGDQWHSKPLCYVRNVKYRRIALHHANFYSSITDHDVDRMKQEAGLEL